MKAKEILINWLEEMIEKHPPVCYKYGYCKEIRHRVFNLQKTTQWQDAHNLIAYSIKAR